MRNLKLMSSTKLPTFSLQPTLPHLGKWQWHPSCCSGTSLTNQFLDPLLPRIWPINKSSRYYFSLATLTTSLPPVWSKSPSHLISIIIGILYMASLLPFSLLHRFSVQQPRQSYCAVRSSPSSPRQPSLSLTYMNGSLSPFWPLLLQHLFLLSLL